jgi:hypothetical protein
MLEKLKAKEPKITATCSCHKEDCGAFIARSKASKAWGLLQHISLSYF